MPYTSDIDNVALLEFPKRDKRTNEVYEEYFKDCYENIEFQIYRYKNAKTNAVKLESALKHIQHFVRRYHELCLKQRDGGYYTQNIDCEKTWEHVIPIGICVRLVIAGKLSIEDFMQMPVMYLSKEDDAKLQMAKLIKTTPSRLYPFKRYAQAGIDLSTITTRDGQQISENWTLNDHINTVKRLTTP